MLLSWIHSESGNEHWDTYETVKIEATGDQIKLVESTQTTNAINNFDKTKSDRYTIAVSDLIELIKAKGNKLP